MKRNEQEDTLPPRAQSSVLLGREAAIIHPFGTAEMEVSVPGPPPIPDATLSIVMATVTKQPPWPAGRQHTAGLETQWAVDLELRGVKA